MATDVNPNFKPYTAVQRLTDLNDVVITSPASPSILIHKNGSWEDLTPATAIATPNAQTGSYVQADVTSLKTAIDAIRVALTAAGITL